MGEILDNCVNMCMCTYSIPIRMRGAKCLAFTLFFFTMRVMMRPRRPRLKEATRKAVFSSSYTKQTVNNTAHAHEEAERGHEEGGILLLLYKTGNKKYCACA
jgi:hypothetical protein